MSNLLKSIQPGVFPEMVELENIINEYSPLVRSSVIEEIPYRGRKFPLYCLEIGSEDPQVPVFGIFGGVHGLERIGTQVILVFLRSFLHSLTWDKTGREKLKYCRLVLMPIVNPVGMFHFRRANGNGVDLMRNSPVEGAKTHRFASGHQWSPHLPFFRGHPEKMELESEALIRVVKEKIWNSPISITLDVHSGFGVRDRIWFPWAHSKEPFPFLHQLMAYKELLDKNHPHHIYVIEPSALHYIIHGDLWDYLFMEFQKEKLNLISEGNPTFLPLTLELGSWLWLKKNPLQAFNRLSIWHPLKVHRTRRVFRRHLHLFDFIQRSLISPEAWLLESEKRKNEYWEKGLNYWYPNNEQEKKSNK